MAKNTGRGSRTSLITSRQQMRTPSTAMWIKADSTTGRFTRAKTRGGSFSPLSFKPSLWRRIFT